MEAPTIAAGHQDRVGHRRSVTLVGPRSLLSLFQRRQPPGARDPPAIHVANGKPDQQMRGPVIGENLVGVELFNRGPRIFQPVSPGPVHEILGGGGPDATDFSIEVSDEAAVLANARVPEGDVLGIEGMTGHDRLRIVHRCPSETVGRLEGIQSRRVVPVTDRLVFRFRLHAGIVVLENREIVRLLTVDFGQHDVVLLGSGVLEEAEFRLHPVNSVHALGVGNSQRV